MECGKGKGCPGGILMPEISIILPTYNEAKNISRLIPELEKVVSEHGFDAEIVVVDDNSPDGTAETAEKLNKKFKNIRVLKREKKEGIGVAMKDAYDFAKGNILLSMDADLQLKAQDITELLKYIGDYDMVFGSKYLEPAKYQRRNFLSKTRFLISKLGNRYLGLVNRTPFIDYSLNFRAMKKKVWKALSPEDKRNFFFVEMIVQAHRKGFKLKEIAVEFKERPYGQSKTRVLNQMGAFLVKGLLLAFKR
jgi:dolichol-phosphate mannosyltransferase